MVKPNFKISVKTNKANKGNPVNVPNKKVVLEDKVVYGVSSAYPHVTRKTIHSEPLKVVVPVVVPVVVVPPTKELPEVVVPVVSKETPKVEKTDVKN
jgi:hypothetical protein